MILLAHEDDLPTELLEHAIIVGKKGVRVAIEIEFERNISFSGDIYVAMLAKDRQIAELRTKQISALGVYGVPFYRSLKCAWGLADRLKIFAFTDDLRVSLISDIHVDSFFKHEVHN